MLLYSWITSLTAHFSHFGLNGFDPMYWFSLLDLFQYEKAAQELSKHDPPIVLAKVDANDEKNKPLATKYEIQGFPTLKIFRNQGKNIQEYKGPREAEGIVEYLKKQVGPASKEIKSPEDATNLIDDKKIYIVRPRFNMMHSPIYIFCSDCSCFKIDCWLEWAIEIGWNLLRIKWHWVYKLHGGCWEAEIWLWLWPHLACQPPSTRWCCSWETIG